MASDPRDVKCVRFSWASEGPDGKYEIPSDYPQAHEQSVHRIFDSEELSLMTLAESHRLRIRFYSWVVDWRQMTDRNWAEPRSYGLNDARSIVQSSVSGWQILCYKG